LSILDIIIFLVLAVGFILGYKDGFVRKLIGLIGFVLAVYFGITYSKELGSIIESALGIEIYLAEIIGGITIFLMIIIVFSILKRFIHPFDKVNNLVNQVTGGIVGAIQILYFMSAFFFLLNVFNVPDKESKNSSVMYEKVYNIIPITIDYLTDYTPATKKLIKNYLNDNDTIK
jgi:membrane protein required for colicin V production